MTRDFPEILESARECRPWALRELWERYGGRVAGYLAAGGCEDPDDLANEVLLRAFTRLDTFAGDESSFRSWAFTIAHNVLLDDRRSRMRRPVIRELNEVDTDTHPAGCVEAEALDRLGTADTQRVINALPDDQRDVLLLRVVADLSLDQTAAVIGKSSGAVKQLQRRAVQRLRRTMAGSGA